MGKGYEYVIQKTERRVGGGKEREREKPIKIWKDVNFPFRQRNADRRYYSATLISKTEQD